MPDPRKTTTAIDTPPALPEALELARLLRPAWAGMSSELRSSGVLLNEGDDDEKVELTKQEHDDLKKAVATKDRELRDTKKELQGQIDTLKEQIEDAGDAGEVEKLQRKLDKAEERAKAAEEKVSELEGTIESSARERDALEAAGQIGFKDPRDAIRFLDSEDLTSKADAERALERVAREKPYLVNKKQRDVTDPNDRKRDPDDGGGDGGKKDDERDVSPGQDRLRRHYEKQAEKDSSERDTAGAT